MTEKPPSNEGRKFDRDEFRKEILGRIKSAIKNPELETLVLGYYFNGELFSPENAIRLTNLSLEKLEAFYSMIIEEIGMIPREDLSEDLRRIVEREQTDEEENTIDHEMKHAREALNQSVRLENCELELFFSTSGFGLRLVHQFITPKDLEPMQKIHIALAPETPSSGDLAVVRKLIEENREYFRQNPELLKQVTEMYLEKTGKGLDVEV